jgi:hypothetical protein
MAAFLDPVEAEPRAEEGNLRAGGTATNDSSCDGCSAGDDHQEQSDFDRTDATPASAMHPVRLR